MSEPLQKKEASVVDGTPEKRLFLSIISDYGLKTGICELVDNALDLWIAGTRISDLHIEVTLDSSRQLIAVRDNAGGVKKDYLRFLVAPGASGNELGDNVIGIFGVGGKRAGVALGERVEIRTRYKKEKTFQIDITNDWLGSPDWHLNTYEIPNIPAGTTEVSISHMRQAFDEAEIEELRKHLSETYSNFLKQGCRISLNDKAIATKQFTLWAYPTGYEPKITDFKINLGKGKELKIKITAGLIRDRDPEKGNYGVYFYCNDRLIVKELKTRDVGYYVSSEAGVPHPDASLCRVIVEMHGPAELMPWNSSKSGINFNHPAFLQIRHTLISLVSYFSSLSRRLKGDWENQVLQYTKGIKQKINAELATNRKLILPILPRVNKAKAETLVARNKKVVDQMPWTLGLVEAMGMVDIISRQKLDTKNRAALILLDSNFEIALKEFIVNRHDLFPPNTYNDTKLVQLFKSRTEVIKEVNGKINLPAAELSKASHYYNLRNKLIHERATVGITDRQVSDYKATVEKILKLLFGLRFIKT